MEWVTCTSQDRFHITFHCLLEQLDCSYRLHNTTSLTDNTLRTICDDSIFAITQLTTVVPVLAKAAQIYRRTLNHQRPNLSPETDPCSVVAQTTKAPSSWLNLRTVNITSQISDQKSHFNI